MGKIVNVGKIKRWFGGIIFALTILYTAMYITLTIPSVKIYIADKIETALCNFLETKVSIGDIRVFPIGRAIINNLVILDRDNNPLLLASRGDVSFSIIAIFSGALEFDNININNYAITLNADRVNNTSNYKFLIEKLSRKGAISSVKIRSLLLSEGSLNFNITKEVDGKSITDTIAISNIQLNSAIRHINKDSINVSLRGLKFNESNGLALKEISFNYISNNDSACLTRFKLETNRSKLLIEEAKANIAGVNNWSEFADMAILNICIEAENITLSDFKGFVPRFEKFNTPISLNCSIGGVINHLNLEDFSLNYGGDLISVSGNASLDNITSNIDNAFIFGKVDKFSAMPNGIISIAKSLSKRDFKGDDVIKNIGKIGFTGEISGFLPKLVTFGKVSTKHGNIDADLMITRGNQVTFNGNISSNGINIGEIIPNKGLGNIGFKLSLNEVSAYNNKDGYVAGDIFDFEYKEYRYSNFKIDGNYSGSKYSGLVHLVDSNAVISIEGKVDLSNRDRMFEVNLKGKGIDVNALNLTEKYANSQMDFDIVVDILGNNIDNTDGSIFIKEFMFANNDTIFERKNASIYVSNSVSPQVIEINTGVVDGVISGKYSFKTLKNSFAAIVKEITPSLYIESEKLVAVDNNFSFDISIPETSLLTQTFELPFCINDEVSIIGNYHDNSSYFSLLCNIPSYNIKRSKLRGGSIALERLNNTVTLDVHSSIINKLGKEISVDVNSYIANDNADIDISWCHEDSTLFSGEIITSTAFSKGNNSPNFNISIHPTNFVVKSEVWHIAEANMFIDDNKEIEINSFEVGSDNQFLKLNGICGADADKSVNVDILNLDLSYIFDVLNRPNIVFGGLATGSIDLNAVMSSEPQLYTKSLFVKEFSYNYCVFGDLTASTEWVNSDKKIQILGDVKQVDKPEVPDTRVVGQVFPTADSLHFSFEAHKTPVTFLRPLTQKIMSNVDGYGSGSINLFGRFKALNVTGRVFAEDFSFGIDYLNTTFSITDSVYLDMDKIYVKGAPIKDPYGNSGSVDFELQHKNFKQLLYNVDIHNLNNFLLFNQTPQLNPVYYGKVFGTGSGTIVGDSSYTFIDISAKTNEGSNFTFVLSDMTDAADYQFITYFDKDTVGVKRNSFIDGEDSNKKPHNIRLNIQVDATNDVPITLVINESTNDNITARGEGGMRIEYDSNDYMKMYGTYTISEGKYSLNLQDLISKEFIVDAGSRLSFRGDPTDAELDLTAYYAVQANLVDLDESFNLETELSRTTVPVHTVLDLSGNLQQPDFKFDLEFPTLSQNIYRRVRSIINTDDMMNRQVLYLLAISKFYTPEYMNVGQTNSNELASVASSALSSQLNNILGQISDKFNIGTNFRSDKGDFSDLEFDVMLSSQLLNNRLIFNGNLGYRDKSVSSNSFVGDFDLEYLINKSGTIRLKAYNHYNDKNYYLKSALTTQGVGVMFKKEFSDIKGLFTSPKRKKRREDKANSSNSEVVVSEDAESEEDASEEVVSEED